MQPALEFSAKRIHFLVIILLAFVPLSGMGIDLIAPSLPAISKNLHISEALAKNLISIYLLGGALGNFFCGFLSDAYGRQKFLLGGMVVFVLVSLLPALYPNAEMLLIARFFQGVSLGLYAVCIRAIFADILSEKRLMHTLPLMTMMWTIGPIVGPVIGSYLQVYFGWQAGFYFFAGAGFLALLCFALFLPETHFRRGRLSLSKIQSDFLEMMRHRSFIGLVLVMAFTYSTLLVFSTLGPFLVERKMGYSVVTYGHLALAFGFVMLATTIVSRQLIKRYDVLQMYAKIVPLAVVIGLILLGFSFFFADKLWMMIICSLLIITFSGLLYPVAAAKSLALFRHAAGSAAAVVNLLNMLITAIGVAIMGWVNITSVFMFMSAYFICVFLYACAYFLLIRPKIAIMPSS